MVQTLKSKLYSGAVALLFASFINGSVFAQLSAGSAREGEFASANAAPWKRDYSQDQERKSLRDRYTKHFQNQDGSFTALSFAGPIHYESPTGAWLDIENAIEVNQGSDGAQYPYKNSRNSFESYYPAAPGASGIKSKLKEGVILEWINPGYAYLRNGQLQGLTAFQSSAYPEVQENLIRYRNVGPGMDVEFIQTNEGRKFHLNLSSAQVLSSIPNDASDFVLYETVRLPEGMRLEKKGTEIRVYDESGQWISQFPIPQIFEDQVKGLAPEDAGSKAVSGDYTIENLGDGEWKIGVKVALSWLRSQSRNYPIVIDPTTNYYPNTGSLITGYITTTTGTPASGYLRVASSSTAAWSKFNISSLPSGSTVSAAVYYGLHYTGTSSPDKICNIRDMASVDPSAGATGSAIYTQATTGTLYSSTLNFAGTTTGLWKSSSLSSGIFTQIQNRRVTPGWVQLGLTWVSGGTGFAYHYGQENSTNKCYLAVTYTTSTYSYDASVSGLIPNSVQRPCLGSSPVSVILTNNGTVTMTSATINWVVNSVSQTAFSWSGSLANGASTTVTLGNYNFLTAGPHSVSATVSSPNGQTDQNSANNTVSESGLFTAMGGTYTIGATGNYTTFAAAVSALQSNGVCAPVTFNVLSGTYSENITIPQIAGASSTNRITFQSQGNDSTLVTLTSASTYPVYMNGADYITFRKMTISTTAATYVFYYLNTCEGNRIENCRLNGFVTTSTTTAYSIIFNSTTANNDANNEFRNNVFNDGSFAFYWTGFTSSPYEGGLIIENNRFINQAFKALYITYCNAPIIRNNYIDNTMNGYATSWGIDVRYCYNNTLITQNDIRSKVYGMYLYYLYATSTQNALVSNNFVNVTHSTGSTLYGIYSFYGDYTNYYHNTVVVTNPVTTSTSYALYNDYGTYKVYQNNIFDNNSVGGANNYTVYFFSSTGTTLDYNDYWFNTGTTNLAYHSSYGAFTPSLWTTFRNPSYGGGNSINIDPLFVSTTNLRHFNGNLNVGVNLLTQVPVDIDGRTRTTPITIGAAEYKPVANDAAITTIVNPPCSGVSSVQAILSSYGTSTLTGTTVNWSVNGISQTPYTWTGSLTQNTNTSALSIGTYNFVMNTNYTIIVWTSSPNGGTDGNTGNDQLSVNTSPALGGTYTIGATGNYTSFASAVSALQTYGVCGPVVFNVQPGTYNETITLTQYNGVNSTNTITFQSLNNDSLSVNLTSASTYTVFMNGADWVRFRKMTITTTGGKCFDFVNGATNNIIENCRVIGYNIATTSTTYYTIGSTSTTNNDADNTIRNNYIRYGSYGVYWYGNTSAPYEGGLVFENNQVVDAYYMGGYFLYLNAPVITRNTFDCMSSTYGTEFPLRVQNLYNSSQITRNTLYGKTYSFYASSVIGTSTLRALIANNAATAHQTNFNSCYAFYSQSNQYCDVLHNSAFSVNQYASSGYTTYAFYDGSSTYTTVQNNIFRDSSTISIYSYAAYLASSTGTTYDYNNYFVESGNTNLAYHNSIGNFTPAQWSSFRSSGYGGANSLNINPNWFTPFNLRHRNSSLNTGINQLALVGVDIDGSTRSTPVTIGSDEYKSTGIDAGITQIVSTPPCVGVGNVVVQFTNHGTTTLTSATITWSINSISQPSFSWTGSLAAGSSVNVTVGTYNFIAGSYLFNAATSNPNNTTDADPSNDAASISSGTALGGTMTIGSTGTYTSFAAAVSALASQGVCAPVVFQVQPGTYTETITISAIPGSSSTNTITFESLNNDSTSVTLTSASTYTIFVNGGDFLRFRKMTVASTGGKCFEFAGGATNNIVENCRIIGYNIASTSTLYYAIGSTSSTNNDEFNTIRNNFIQYGSYGVYWYGNSSAPYESGLVFDNNQIYNSYIYGAFFQYLNAPVITRNTFDITGSTYTSTSYALRTSFIYNGADVSRNYIYGRTYAYYANSIIGTSSVRPKISNNFIVSLQNQNNTCYGLYSASNQYADFAHNSVNTNHLNALLGYTTYTLFETGSTFTNYQNNIFCDSTVANPYSYAAYLSPSTSTLFDYNNYFVQPGSSNIAYHSSYGTFAPGIFTTFRSSLYGGANSVNLRPGFYSFTNLRHRNTGLNAGLNLISIVPADFDGQTRTTTVTIGADEFKPVANDAGIAQIITSLPCQGVNNVVVSLSNYGTATLTSATINWTMNSVAQTAYSWTGSLASGASVNVTLGTYNFISGNYALWASTSNPNGQTDGDNFNDAVNGTLGAALSGSYTIGATGTYPNFTAAVSALTSAGVCGPVTFTVQSGTYTENITLPQINGSSSTNRITFQGQSDSTLVVLTSSSTYPINVNGGDYFTFRKMTVSTTAATYVVWVQNGAIGNQFENCQLIGFNNSGTTSSYSVIFSSSTGVNDMNNEFRNNRIENGTYGIFWQGFTSSPYEQGLVIEGNRFINNSYIGIYIYYTTGTIIRNNFIDNTMNAYSLCRGIDVQYCYNNTTITGNDVRSKAYGMYLYYMYGSSGLPALVANNFVNVTASSATSIYGIYSYYGDYHNVYHNSVTSTNANTSSLSYTLNDNYGTYKNYLNNIFRNNGPAGTANYSAYLFPSTGTTYNYNDYWVPSGSTNLAYHSSWGAFTPAQFTTFANLSYGGANSVNVDPVFLSSTNLRHANLLLNVGQNLITQVPLDIDGAPRFIPVTLGAFDFKTPNDAGATTILNNPPCVGVNTVQVIIANYGTVTLTGATINWTVNSVPQTPFAWTGSVPQGQSSSAISIGTYNFLTSTNYTIVASTASPNGGTDGNTSNDQVSSTSLPATMSGTYTIGATGNYTTFAAAVSALQTDGVCGPVVFNVQNGTYTENITIPQITGANSINTITFQSLNNDSTLVTLTSSSTYPVFMNGADYTRFRKMTIQAGGLTYAMYYLNTCVGNRVENCRIIGQPTSSTTTSYALVFNSTTANNDADNQFLNNRFENGSMGLYWTGFTTSPYEGGFVVEGNQFINQSYYGIYLTYMNAPVIRNNFMDNTMNAYTSNFGLYIQYCYNNTLITRNEIRSRQYGMYLYYLYGTGTQKAEISNNFISVSNPTGNTCNTPRKQER